MSAVVDRLEALAERDEVLAPLARLYACVLRLASAPESQLFVQLLRAQAPQPSASVPLLHEQTLAVDVGQLARLLQEMSRVLVHHGLPASGELAEAITSGRLVALELIRAGVQAHTESLEQLALNTSLPDPLVRVMAHMTAMAVLSVLGRSIETTALEGWWAGYCPVCAAWPTVAEFRGLERDRWLRCGRCGTGWRYPHQQCPFCGNSDHRTLRYFAEEGKQDSQRVEVCEQCRGYVKTFATLGPWSHGEVLLQDLVTVEFDLAAQEREYRRPEGLGFPLAVQIVARELAA
ncbi:Protein FdhE [bacterium HR28]|nr:Protein FdhE [bacterium HR28]